MAKKRKSPAAAAAATSNPNPEEPKKPKVEPDPKKEELIEAIREESESESSEEESDSSDEESTKENLKKLLEPFNKEQIVDFIVQAALKDPSIVARIVKSAEADPALRKIFVFGLGWDATQEQLLAAFKPFGELEEFKLVTDKVTGRAKGYAFLQYKTLKAAKKALKQPQKKIGNRMTTCQLASSGEGRGNSPPEMRKMYVANVGPQVVPEKLKAFFGKFGEIEEGPIGIDNLTGKFRGYAIFVFKSADGLKKALEEPIKMFDGFQLQCRPANKNPPPGSVAATVGSSSAVPLQQSAGANYGLGVNPGFNPAALMMAQSQGLGLTNPLMGLSGNGISPNVGYGLGGMNPNLLAGYNPFAALQGLSAYQSQLGQSSAGPTPVAGQKPQSGGGSAGISYASFGR